MQVHNKECLLLWYIKNLLVLAKSTGTELVLSIAMLYLYCKISEKRFRVTTDNKKDH